MCIVSCIVLANTSQLKRQHSAEPLSEANATRKSPHLKNSDSPTAGTPQSVNSLAANAGTPPPDEPLAIADAIKDTIGSPFKRQRSSLPGLDISTLSALDAPPAAASTATASLQSALFSNNTNALPMATDEDEEL